MVHFSVHHINESRSSSQILQIDISEGHKINKLLVFVDLPENPCVDDDMVFHVLVGHPNAPVPYLFMTVSKDAICDCELFDDSTCGFP